MVWRIFAALTLTPLFALQTGDAEELSRLIGTHVIVKADGAEVFRGGRRPAATLPGGMMVTVAQVRSGWLWVNRGWIRPSDVVPYDMAVEFFTREIEKSPDAAAYNHRSRVWCYLGEFQKAVADAKEAIRLDAGYAAAWCNLGRGQAGLDEVGGAIASFTKAIELDPQFSTAYSHRGRAWTEKGDFARAVADCDRALALDPQSHVAHYYRGRALARDGRSAEAIKDFTQAIQLDSHYVPALNDRGIEHARQRRYSLAIADFDAAIKADPRLDLVQIHYNRGNAWFGLGIHPRALADYRVVLRHDSRNLPAMEAMAACYAHHGRYEEAVEWQRKAIEATDGANRGELLATLDRYSRSASADTERQDF